MQGDLHVSNGARPGGKKGVTRGTWVLVLGEKRD